MMIRSQVLFLILLFLIIAASSFAASTDYIHKTWTTRTTRSGLPQNTVNCVVRGKGGYLWLGTQNHLVRFDGTQFKTVPIFEPSKHIDKITTLMISSEGHLWIGTHGNGIAVLRENGFKYYSTANGLPCDFIRTITEDNEKNIRIGTMGKGVVTLKNNTFTSFTTSNGLSHNNVSSLVAGNRGDLWAGTDNGLNYLANGKCTTFTPEHGLPDNYITTLLLDGSEQLWVGTLRGIAVADTQTGPKVFKPFKQLNAMAHSILRDRDGLVWIASDRGVYNIAPGAGGETFNVRRVVVDGLFNNSVISLYEDREGILWFGTRGRGFGGRYTSPFRFYSVSHGLSHPDITTVYQDEKKNMWFGTRGGGLNRFVNGTFKTYTIQDGLNSNWVTALYGDKNGTIWIGTPVGLNLLRNGRIERFPGRDAPHSFILSLVVAGSGNTWIGTNGEGLYSYTPKDRKFQAFGTAQGLSNLFVTVVAEDGAGELWVGTRSGLFRFRRGQFQPYDDGDGLDRRIISDIYPAPDGVVWIAVSGAGLYRYRDGVFTPFVDPGLPFTKSISRILEDNRRRLWLTTANGIFCVPVSGGSGVNGPAYRFFGESVSGTAVFSGGGRPAGWKAADQDLWFPTSAGVIEVSDTEKMFELGSAGKVHIESVLVDDTTVDLVENNRIPVVPGKIEFICNTPNFTAPESVIYKYRLEPKMYDLLGNLWPDREEVRVSRDRRVVYDDLLPGRFVFSVFIAGAGGEWKKRDAASVEFYIRRPFVDTLWFYLLLMAAGLMAAAVVFVFIKRWSKERVLLPIWAQGDKYKTFKLSNKESRRWLRTVMEVMEKEKPFLDPDITMPKLAKRMNMSKEELSQVINRELHLNFNAFINQYRIEEAKRKLRDPKENQFVILKIALDVGFNSKSSFNAVFKKTTGMSPTEYRENYQKK